MSDLVDVGRFAFEGNVVIGVVSGDRVRVVDEGDRLRDVLEQVTNSTLAPDSGPVLALSDCLFLPPIDPASRVFAVAVNYHAHGAEAGRAPPTRPITFYKAPTNFVGHGGTLDPHAELTAKFDYEGEIGVVIGRRCSRVTAADAMDYVAGVCAVNDGSARDLTAFMVGETRWVDWTAAKALDNASALGPVISCSTALRAGLAERTLTFETRLNGVVVQEGRLSETIFGPAELISILSSYMTLLPGDVIATGTPAGVGMARNRFLRTGDALEIAIHGLRPLSVTVG